MWLQKRLTLMYLEKSQWTEKKTYKNYSWSSVIQDVNCTVLLMEYVWKCEICKAKYVRLQGDFCKILFIFGVIQHFSCLLETTSWLLCVTIAVYLSHHAPAPGFIDLYLNLSPRVNFMFFKNKNHLFTSSVPFLK